MLIAAVALAAAVACAPTPAELHAGLAGQWRGALGYRDYQSNKLFELPVTTEFRMIPDAATEVAVSAFDDGPKAGTVYITSLSLFDAKAGTVISTSFRKAGRPDIETGQVSVTAFGDATHWTLIYEATASDDNKPARIRVTETRDGETLLSVKEVAPNAPEGAPFRFRNQTRLTRVP